MGPYLAVALMFLGPIAAGIVLGLVQLAFYRLKRTDADRIPAFVFLFARGLLAAFVLAAVLAVAMRFA